MRRALSALVTAMGIVAGLALYPQAAPAAGAETELVRYSHNRDCDFGCGSSLSIFRDGRATLFIGGNRYAPEVPCIGLFRGRIPAGDVAELEALFQDPLFRDAPEDPPQVLDGVVGGLSFSNGTELISKTFSQHTLPPETIAHLEKIYTFLAKARADLLTTKPEIGLKAEPERIRYDARNHRVDVEFSLRNIGTRSVRVVPPFHVFAALHDGNGNQAALTPLEKVGAEKPGNKTIPPGGRSGRVFLRADLSSLPSTPVEIVWGYSFGALLPGDDERRRMEHVGRQDVSLPKGRP